MSNIGNLRLIIPFYIRCYIAEPHYISKAPGHGDLLIEQDGDRIFIKMVTVEWRDTESLIFTIWRRGTDPKPPQIL